MHTKSEKNPVVAPTGEQKIRQLFLINEGYNQECCHGNRISSLFQLLSSCSLFQFEESDVISVLQNSIECSFVCFIKVSNSWARSSYSFDKKLKSIEKKLIIVKNQ